MLALAVLIAAVAVAPATPAALPNIRFTGQTTSGTSVLIPDDARGEPLVLVVGLTRGSAEATARWSEALEKRVGRRAAIYGVALLDKVPRIAREWVRRGIARSIGPAQTGSAAFLTTFDGTALRDAAPGGAEDNPVLYVLRSGGTTAYVVRAPFSDDAAEAVERALR